MSFLLSPRAATKSKTFWKKAGSGFSVPVSSAVKVAKKGDPSCFSKWSSAQRRALVMAISFWDFASSANAAVGGNPGQAGGDAAFEVDQRADDIEGHVFEFAKAPGQEWLSSARGRVE